MSMAAPNIVRLALKRGEVLTMHMTSSAGDGAEHEVVAARKVHAHASAQEEEKERLCRFATKNVSTTEKWPEREPGQVFSHVSAGDEVIFVEMRFKLKAEGGIRWTEPKQGAVQSIACGNRLTIFVEDGRDSDHDDCRVALILN